MSVSLETIIASMRESRKALKNYVDDLLNKYDERQAQRKRDGIKVVSFSGHGRAGKDASAELLAHHTHAVYGASTSAVINPVIAHSPGVPADVAWDHRHKDRMYWKVWCDAFRGDDPTILARMLLANGDIIVGIRGKPEFYAVMNDGVADHAVWVHRPGVPEDPTMDYDAQDVLSFKDRASFLDNDGDLSGLRNKTYFLAEQLKMLRGD